MNEQSTPPFPTGPAPSAVASQTRLDALENQLRASRALNLVLVVISVVLCVALYLTHTGATSTAVDADSSGGVAPGASPADPAQEQSGPTPTGSALPTSAYVRNIDGDPMAVGDIDAPVVMSEWTDLRCPFCALVARQTLPVLIQEYVDAGKVRIEFNDVSYFGDQSREAAIAARAAGAQGMYLEYLETLFAAAPDSGHPDLPRGTLVGFAREAGVPDLEAFTASLDDPDLGRSVDASTANAQTLGISSVPFFVIDGRAVAGAQDTAVFRSVIDQALAESGR